MRNFCCSQPTCGSMTGPLPALPFTAVVAATCLSAAVGSLLMGICARYPIALAPGMGLNAFFASTLVGSNFNFTCIKDPEIDRALEQGRAESDPAKRKAAYVEYAQAVPLKYAIDGDECIFIKKGKCGACKKICPTGAVDFDQKETTHRVQVGSIVLSAGFTPFDPAKFDNYQYAKLPNVITSMEFERMLSASGPTAGHVKRLSKDGRDPKKIAWFQCVGSRDMNKCDNAHCSSVCCMYAIKEAVIAKEHAGKGLDCAVFFMDMRTHGKEFERFYDEARDKHGVRFVRSKVHSVTPVGETDDLEIRYVAENGELKTELFDLIVLSVGMEISPPLVDLAQRLHIDLTPGKFCSTSSFAPVATSRDGIFVCGAFQGPKDIPQSVMEASAAAAAAGELLDPGHLEVAAVGHPLDELVVDGVHPLLDLGGLRGAQVAVPAKQLRLERAAPLRPFAGPGDESRILLLQAGV